MIYNIGAHSFECRMVGHNIARRKSICNLLCLNHCEDRKKKRSPSKRSQMVYLNTHSYIKDLSAYSDDNYMGHINQEFR